MQLAFAPFGKEMQVTRINADDKTKRHLESLGIIIGANITSVFDNKGDVILKVHAGKLALNKSLAMKITTEML